MKKLITLLLLISAAYGQSFRTIKGKQNFTDSLKLSTYHNNVAEDSALIVDQNGVIHQKYFYTGGGSATLYTGDGLITPNGANQRNVYMPVNSSFLLSDSGETSVLYLNPSLTSAENFFGVIESQAALTFDEQAAGVNDTSSYEEIDADWDSATAYINLQPYQQTIMYDAPNGHTFNGPMYLQTLASGSPSDSILTVSGQKVNEMNMNELQNIYNSNGVVGGNTIGAASRLVFIPNQGIKNGSSLIFTDSAFNNFFGIHPQTYDESIWGKISDTANGGRSEDIYFNAEGNSITGSIGIFSESNLNPHETTPGIYFYADTSANSYYTGIKGDSVSLTGEVNIDSAYNLPRTDGTSGQVLTTDGAGNVSWGAGGSSTIKTTNGLSFSGDSAQIGGTLNKTTTLNTAGNTFTILNMGQDSLTSVPLISELYDGSSTSLGDVKNILSLYRKSNIANTDGFGESVNFYLQSSAGVNSKILSNQFISSWVDNSTPISEFQITGNNAGTTDTLVSANAGGQVKFNQYTGSSFFGLLAHRLGVDANGNIIQDTTSIGGSGGGTLTGVTGNSPVTIGGSSTIPNVSVDTSKAVGKLATYSDVIKKVNYSDTSAMLSNYLTSVGYALLKSGQAVRVDSATLAAYFLRRKDSTVYYPYASNPKGYVSAITMTGDATGSLSGGVISTTVGKINGVSLASLSTGILKNTTSTGVLSIAVASDFPTLNQNTTGSAATWTTGRTLSITGDISYTSPSINGSASVTAAATLATTGVGAGSCTNCNLTYDAKGRLTAASNGSGGSGGTLSNLGGGYTLAVAGTSNVKTNFGGVYFLLDSSSHTNGLTFNLDTASLFTTAIRRKDSTVYYPYKSNPLGYLVSSSIAGKVNYTDTSSMLSTYINSVGYGIIKTGQSVKLDTATLFVTALRRKDSTLYVTAYQNSLKQNQINGTGFVKATGTTISYDNSTYLSSIDTGNISNFSVKVRSLFSATAPIHYTNGNLTVDTGRSANSFLVTAYDLMKVIDSLGAKSDTTDLYIYAPLKKINDSTLAMGVNGSNDLTGQTSPGTIVTYTTGASDSSFQVSGYINTTAISTDVLQFQVVYTDVSNTSRTLTLGSNISTTGDYQFNVRELRVKASTTITVKTNNQTGGGSETFYAGASITGIR